MSDCGGCALSAVRARPSGAMGGCPLTSVRFHVPSERRRTGVNEKGTETGDGVRPPEGGSPQFVLSPVRRVHSSPARQMAAIGHEGQLRVKSYFEVLACTRSTRRTADLRPASPLRARLALVAVSIRRNARNTHALPEYLSRHGPQSQPIRGRTGHAASWIIRPERRKFRWMQRSSSLCLEPVRFWPSCCGKSGRFLIRFPRLSLPGGVPVRQFSVRQTRTAEH